MTLLHYGWENWGRLLRATQHGWQREGKRLRTLGQQRGCICLWTKTRQECVIQFDGSAFYQFYLFWREQKDICSKSRWIPCHHTCTYILAVVKSWYTIELTKDDENQARSISTEENIGKGHCFVRHHRLSSVASAVEITVDYSKLLQNPELLTKKKVFFSSGHHPVPSFSNRIFCLHYYILRCRNLSWHSVEFIHPKIKKNIPFPLHYSLNCCISKSTLVHIQLSETRLTQP